MSTDRRIDRLDRIEERLLSIDRTLAVNTTSLQDHIRRTELLEKGMDVLVSELKPVQRHVTQVETVLKVLGAIAAIIGTLAAVAKILEFLL